MAFTNKAAPAVAPVVTPDQDAVVQPIAKTDELGPVGDTNGSPGEVGPVGIPDPVVGTQFMETISRAADGTKIEAMKIGQRGVVVVIGFASVFVPGADIIDRGQGKVIV